MNDREFQEQRQNVIFNIDSFSLTVSVATHFDQKSATFVAKSSQKVANFYRQILLNKRRFLCQINTCWRNFFLSELKFF